MLKDINIGALDLRNPTDPEEFKDESFEMTRAYVPTTEIDLIQLNGKRVLTNGNLMLIIARPGTGKTSVVEAMIANGVNESSDAFGFAVRSKNILLIDTERVKNDLYRGFQRIVKRGKVVTLKNGFTGDRITGVTIRSYKFLESKEEFLKHLEVHAAEGYTLIIIDQIADFLRSINNEEEANAVTIRCMKIAEKYDCGIIMTIHPNPKDKEFKARGHIGTALQNKAETVFAAFRGDDETTILTTDFDHGKVRNGPRVGTSYMWDDAKGMHISAFLTEDEIRRKASKDFMSSDGIIEDLFAAKMFYSEKDLLAAFRKKMELPDLEWSFIQDYIDERGTIYKSDMDDNYYLKDVMDLDAPF